MCPSSSPSSRPEQGRRPEAAAAADSAVLGHSGGRERGGKGREVRECDSRPHLGLGWRAEAGRRERAAAALVARGGGARAREERLEAAEVVAGMAGGSGSLL